MKRRQFISSTPAMIGTGILASQLNAMNSLAHLSKIKTVLFQGDSITDAGRDKNNEVANNRNALGGGYAFLAAAGLMGKYPELQLQIHNRGISGHKVFQLRDRWQKDCYDIQPDVLSILIGVNDHWHTLNNYDGTPEVYHNDYDQLLSQTKTKLPNVKLILCEPFILLEGTAIEKDKWIPIFDQYRKSAKTLAKKYKAEFVPFQSIFDEALKKAPASYWAPDGVHPALPGAQLMASHWLEAFARVV